MKIVNQSTMAHGKGKKGKKGKALQKEHACILIMFETSSLM